MISEFGISDNYKLQMEMIFELDNSLENDYSINQFNKNMLENFTFQNSDFLAAKNSDSNTIISNDVENEKLLHLDIQDKTTKSNTNKSSEDFYLISGNSLGNISSICQKETIEEIHSIKENAILKFEGFVSNYLNKDADKKEANSKYIKRICSDIITLTESSANAEYSSNLLHSKRNRTDILQSNKIFNCEKINKKINNLNCNELYSITTNTSLINNNNYNFIEIANKNLLKSITEDEEQKIHKRKYDYDSINKKLKSDSLNFASSKANEKDLFSNEEKIAVSIETNKVFIELPMIKIYENYLMKRYKNEKIVEEKLFKISELNGKEYLNMSYADFFQSLYLQSHNFKAKLNECRGYYAQKFFLQAIGFVNYYRNTPANKTPKGKRVKITDN